MKNYKGLIFDLDGVICSTDQLHYEAWKKIAQDLNLSFNKQMNDKLRGIGRDESFEIIVKENHISMNQYQIKNYAKLKNEVYLQLLESMDPSDLSEEVANTLIQIKKLGYKIAIGSSSRNAKAILDKLGIIEWFDAISDGTNIQNGKPNPEVFIKAADYLGLKPEDCLIIEDADVGIEAANQGGFDSAGIGVASHNSNSTYQLNQFKELLHYL